MAGDAEPRVGAVGVLATVHVDKVLQPVVVQPKEPPVLLDCTITLPVAPVVFIVDELEYVLQLLPPSMLN